MPWRAELLSIGSELTSGTTVNTNVAYLAQQLEALGLTCQQHTTVGDEPQALAAALQAALGRCDLLVTTGGLGPTFDDITIATLADVAARPLRRDPATERAIRRFYTRRHRQLQQAALRQALVPAGALALPNPLGTAPGLWFPLPHPIVVTLPGVPSEMRAIFEHSVRPRLRRLPGRMAVASCTLRTAGIVELSIEQHLKRLGVPPGVQVGLYPHLRTVDVRFTSRGAQARHVRAAAAALQRRLGQAVYGEADELMEGVIGQLLRQRRLTVAVAESCTGGLVSDRLTNVPGSSSYFRGSIVAYHNDVKRRQLGVSPSLLQHHGAVSAAVARAMAAGARHATAASIGVGVTGIAGPTGHTPTKPVGLVYLSVTDGRQHRTERCRFFGDRLSIKAQAAQTALDLLRRFLLQN